VALVVDVEGVREKEYMNIDKRIKKTIQKKQRNIGQQEGVWCIA